MKRLLPFGLLLVITLLLIGQQINTNAVLNTDISTPAAPVSGKTFTYTKGGKLCAEDPSAGETCTGSGGGGGALVLLEQHTASSSASLDFTSFISSTYDTYIAELVGILPATSGANLILRMGAGSVDSGNDYQFVGLYNGVGDSLTGFSLSPSSAIQMAATVTNSNTAFTIDGSWKFQNLASTTLWKTGAGTITSTAGGSSALYQWTASGLWESAPAADRLSFLFSSGAITSGTVRMYGVTK